MSLSLRSWPLWDFVYPPLCAYCSRPLVERDLLYCRQCWADAPIAEPKKKLHAPSVDMMRAGYFFSGGNMVRAAVHGLKYDGFADLAVEMARRMLPRIPTRFLEHTICWTPVPLHWSRHLVRGFNQSQLLLNGLLKVTGHKNHGPLLKRVRNTPTQTARSIRERRVNVQGAFSIQPKLTQGKIPKTVLLIDDVITTGATVNECASVLKSSGVEWVGVLAFALTEIETSSTF
jgi:ComF family protein